MLNWKIYQVIDAMIYKDIRQRVSLLKLFKTLKQFKVQLRNVIRGYISKLDEVLRELKMLCKYHLIHDNRVDRINWKSVENI